MIILVITVNISEQVFELGNQVLKYLQLNQRNISSSSIFIVFLSTITTNTNANTIPYIKNRTEPPKNIHPTVRLKNVRRRVRLRNVRQRARLRNVRQKEEEGWIVMEVGNDNEF